MELLAYLSNPLGTASDDATRLRERIGRGTERLRERYQFVVDARRSTLAGRDERGKTVVEVEHGRRYSRIAEREQSGHRNVLAFVDRGDGRVFAPKSWKGPSRRRTLGSVLGLQSIGY